MTSDLLPEQSGLLIKKLLSDGIEDPLRDADLVELRVDRVFAARSDSRSQDCWCESKAATSFETQSTGANQDRLTADADSSP